MGAVHSQLGAWPAIHEQPDLFAAPAAQAEGGAVAGGGEDVGVQIEAGRAEGKDIGRRPDAGGDEPGDVDASGPPDLQLTQVQTPDTTGPIKARQIFALLQRQGFKCAYTGDRLEPDETGADHIHPVSRGGGHRLDNIALVSQTVNRMKGDRTLEEFVGICRKVVAVFGASGPVELKR